MSINFFFYFNNINYLYLIVVKQTNKQYNITIFIIHNKM